MGFDSLIRFPKSITYNKKQENGMVMVKNCKRLLYALVGKLRFFLFIKISIFHISKIKSYLNMDLRKERKNKLE